MDASVFYLAVGTAFLLVSRSEEPVLREMRLWCGRILMCGGRGCAGAVARGVPPSRRHGRVAPRCDRRVGRTLWVSRMRRGSPRTARPTISTAVLWVRHDLLMRRETSRNHVSRLKPAGGWGIMFVSCPHKGGTRLDFEPLAGRRRRLYR